MRMNNANSSQNLQAVPACCLGLCPPFLCGFGNLSARCRGKMPRASPAIGSSGSPATSPAAAPGGTPAAAAQRCYGAV